MIEKSVIFAVILLLSFVVVFADDYTSDADSYFSAEGCQVDEGGTSLLKGGLGSCMENRYFCKSDNNPQSVFDVPDACTKGTAYVDGVDTPRDICCSGSQGYKCVYLEDYDAAEPYDFFVEEDFLAGYYCVASLRDCSSFDNSDECENYNPKDGNAGQCFWDSNGEVGGDIDGDGDTDGLCVPNNMGCYDYKTDSDCIGDAQNLSQNDVNCNAGGYSSGGVQYNVNQESCECVWDDGVCGLRYNVTDPYGPGKSLCTFTLKENSEGCVDGFQDYLYVAHYDDSVSAGGLGNILPGNVACANRSGTKRCGEEIVKVPFFDFMNFLLVIVVLSGVYFFRNKIFIWCDE